MSTELGSLILNGVNTAKNAVVSKNGGASDVEQTIASTASQLLNAFFSGLGDQEKAEVEKDEKELNSIDKSKETVVAKTGSAIEKCQEEIRTLSEKLQENLKKMEEANAEKVRIEESLQCELKTIEDAQNILNDSNKTHEERLEAINNLRVSKEIIQGLTEASNSLAQNVETLTQELDSSKELIGEYRSEAETVLNEGNTELNNLQAKTTVIKQKDVALETQGGEIVTQGGVDIAKGEAMPVGGEPYIERGTTKVENGTDVVSGATKNISKGMLTSGMIKTDLSQITTNRVSIGSAANTLVSSYDQIHNMWGVLGQWSAEYSQVLGDNADPLETAISNAEEIVNAEQPAEGENDGDANSSDNNGTKDNKDTKGQSSDGQKVFEYDLSNLKGLFSTK